MEGEQQEEQPDSEEEVFFLNTEQAPVTSTPVAAAATASAKRKREDTPPARRTRLRSRRSAGRMGSKEKNEFEDLVAGASGESDSGEGTSVAAMIAKIAKDLATLTKNVGSMEQNIRDTVADSIAPLSVKIDASSLRMDRMEAKQTQELKKMKESMDVKIREVVEEKIREMPTNSKPDKSDNTTEETNTYAKKASLPAKQPKEPARGNRQDWYWRARKCLRFYPITGENEQQLMVALDDFVINKLKVPTGVLNKNDISFIRKVKTARKSKVRDELLVSFSSIEARDLVLSYARNLGNWIDEKGAPLAGLRLEIPEKMIGDFKTLEQYGHALKEKHGAGFKRHIKMDDMTQELYLDVYLPRSEKWVRVDLDLAKKDNEARKNKKKRSVAQEDLMTTEEEGNTSMS